MQRLSLKKPTLINMLAGHTSVLVKETLEALQIKSSDTVVDATLGGAGHFKTLLACLDSSGLLIGIDADPSAVERAREVYAQDRRVDRPTTHLITDNFRNLCRILERLEVGTVDKILLDLGWSGFQIASPRGFSFQGDENQPLLMTYGESGDTAADIVNTASEAELADIIFTFGEERHARSIARAVVEQRRQERILTTGALVRAVLAGTPNSYHHRKIHPATKTFQALRIVVNDEINALREGLSAAIRALSLGGRIAVITFHSIEDRIVKSVFRRFEESEIGAMNPKKAILPSHTEIRVNRSARSAKLRVFECALKTSSGDIFCVDRKQFTYAS